MKRNNDRGRTVLVALSVVLVLACLLAATGCTEATLMDVQVLSRPDVTNYTEAGTFSAEGLSLLAEYSDGTQRVVRYATGGGLRFEGDVTDSGGSVRLTPGSTVVTRGGTVTVTYSDRGVSQSAEFKVGYMDLVDAKSIAVSPLSGMAMEFAKGEEFDYGGLVLDIRYRDDMMLTRTVDELGGGDLTVYAGDGNSWVDQGMNFPDAGEWTVTVKYTPELKLPVGFTSRGLVEPVQLTCTYTVKVTEPVTLDGMEVLTRPHVTNYARGGKFSAEGLSLLARYSDGTERTILYDGSNMSFRGDITESGEATLTPDSVVTKGGTVTVSYGGMEATFPVTYQAPRKVSGISVVDKSRYEVTYTVDAGAIYPLPNDMTLDVRYDDGTVERVTDPAWMMVDTTLVRLDVAGTYTVEVSYTDPDYPDDTPQTDTYLVKVVEPVIGRVEIVSVELVYEATGNVATDRNVPVELDYPAYYRVTFGSDVPNATYTYCYGNNLSVSGGHPVTATGMQVSVEIPYDTIAGGYIWLTKVAKDDYEPFVSTNVFQPLAVIGTVDISIDVWNPELELSGSGLPTGTRLQYWNSFDGFWRDYDEDEKPLVFPEDMTDDETVVRVRAVDMVDRLVSRTKEVKYERVPADLDVYITPGHMVEGSSLPENWGGVNYSYPTVTVELYGSPEVKVVIGSDPTEWSDPEDKRQVTVAVTSEENQSVALYVGFPAGGFMARRVDTVYDAAGWTRKPGGYAVGEMGPMGGKIIQSGDAEGGTWEVVIPEEMKNAGVLCCFIPDEGEYTTQEFAARFDSAHRCLPGNTCQMWNYTHQVHKSTGVCNLDADTQGFDYFYNMDSWLADELGWTKNATRKSLSPFSIQWEAGMVRLGGIRPADQRYYYRDLMSRYPGYGDVAPIAWLDQEWCFIGGPLLMLWVGLNCRPF